MVKCDRCDQVIVNGDGHQIDLPLNITKVRGYFCTDCMKSFEQSGEYDRLKVSTYLQRHRELQSKLWAKGKDFISEAIEEGFKLEMVQDVLKALALDLTDPVLGEQVQQGKQERRKWKDLK